MINTQSVEVMMHNIHCEMDAVAQNKYFSTDTELVVLDVVIVMLYKYKNIFSFQSVLRI